VAVRVTTSEVWYKEAWSQLTDEQKAALTPEQLATYVIPVGSGEGQVPADAVIINTSNESLDSGESWDWIDNRSTDGYYYYGKKLAPQNTTTTFIDGVTLNSNLDVESECDNGVETTDPDTGKKTTTKTCSTSVAGLGKATYVLTITVETVQFDQYKAVWGNNAPNIAES
jgi:alternate signal-mediated exported protein